MLVFWDSWLRSSAFLHSSTCLGRCDGRPGRQDRSQHLGANCQGTIHSLEWRWLDLWAHWWRDYPRGPGHWCNRVTLRRIFLPPADEICCEAYQRSGQDVFNKAMVTSAEEACERAEKIGFPIMVKASEGRPQGWRRNIYIYIYQPPANAAGLCWAWDCKQHGQKHHQKQQQQQQHHSLHCQQHGEKHHQKQQQQQQQPTAAITTAATTTATTTTTPAATTTTATTTTTTRTTTRTRTTATATATSWRRNIYIYIYYIFSACIVYIHIYIYIRTSTIRHDFWISTLKIWNNNTEVYTVYIPRS